MFTCSTLQATFKNILRISLLGILAASHFACAPRGETKTLSEIVKNSQAYFAEASEDAKPSQDAEAELKALSADLNALIATKTVSTSDIEKIAPRIAKLIPLAGYTNRPGLTQLERQWIDLAASDHFSKNFTEKPRKMDFERSPALSLLAARTFRTLARELETTGFRV